MASDVGLARCARQVAGAAAHQCLEVGALETFDGASLGVGERSRQIERISLRFAAAKPVALPGDVA